MNWSDALSAGLASDDFFEYDPVANQWTDLKGIVFGLPPAARTAHGFTGSNGKIYLFGGLTDFGRFNNYVSLK